MRPLASPIVEQRTIGLVLLSVAGASFGFGLLDDARPLELLKRFAIAAALLGILWAVFGARYARQATVEPAPLPGGATEEATSGTVRREALKSAAVGAVMLVSIFLFVDVGDEPTQWAMGGIPLGFGLGSLLTAWRWAMWERRHGAKLLREPRYRGGWRGRGGFDPRDFYARPTRAT
jgi:hypothetical protein